MTWSNARVPETRKTPRDIIMIPTEQIRTPRPRGAKSLSKCHKKKKRQREVEDPGLTRSNASRLLPPPCLHNVQSRLAEPHLTSTSRRWSTSESLFIERVLTSHGPHWRNTALPRELFGTIQLVLVTVTPAWSQADPGADLPPGCGAREKPVTSSWVSRVSSVASLRHKVK